MDFTKAMKKLATSLDDDELLEIMDTCAQTITKRKIKKESEALITELKTVLLNLEALGVDIFVFDVDLQEVPVRSEDICFSIND